MLAVVKRESELKEWTADEVADWFEEAAQTLLNLPPVGVQGCLSNWPDFVQEVWDAYGWNDIVLNRIRPSARAIDRLDQVIEWTQWLEFDERKILWLRAAGVKWKRICTELGISRTSAHNKYSFACVRISSALNIRDGIFPRRKK